MKMKKMIMTLGVTLSVMATPLTVLAAHTHTCIRMKNHCLGKTNV